MNYIVAALSDKGSRNKVNEDALIIRTRMTCLGAVCLAAICDGMGGLAEGEVASAHTIRRIGEWFSYRAGSIKRFDKLVYCLERELHEISKEIMAYGQKNQFAIGTTATMFISAGKEYAIIHVGDSRVYEAAPGRKLRRLTTDQSINDVMLLQAVGTTDNLKPEIIKGKVNKNSIIILCTDGFRHKNSDADLNRGFLSGRLINRNDMERVLRVYTDRARKLGENDDISVIAVKIV